MSALPIKAAAERLDVAPGTLKRWIREGCPTARRGRRGRGCATLVDPVAVAAWRSADGGGHDLLIALAGDLPELVADAVWQVQAVTDGPHRDAVAGALAACWYQVTLAIADRIRQDAPDAPEPSALPEKIERLRSIFGRAGRL
jgi:hypothetical protein